MNNIMVAINKLIILILFLIDFISLYLYCEIFNDADVFFFKQRLVDNENVYSIIAYIDDKPIGFKVGYYYSDDTFYSWVGGILPDYRKKGIATKLAELQEQYAKSAGYSKLRTKSMNQYKSMMILNLKRGFDIVKFYTNEKGQTKIVFEKLI